MIRSLKDARITDGLPKIVAGQDWVRALDDAIGRIHEQTMRYADDSQIYTALETAPEDILDTLAIDWKVDWYDTDYGIDQKRRIITTALTVRRLMGTAYATREQANAIYPGVQLEEWFDYGGEPGTFRMYVDISQTTEDNPAEAYNIQEMERRVAWAKRQSAHMENFSFMVRHGIVLGCKIVLYTAEATECGTTYCGTQWTDSTLGYSAEDEILLGADIGAYAMEPAECNTEYCGTQWTKSTIGASAAGSVAMGAQVDAYTTSPSECGTAYCGA
jgi:phage tail P2-like protein